MVDPAGRHDGDVHVAARHHRRQRGASVDSRRSRRELHRPAVGDRRLRADPRRAGPHRRLARRPAGPPPGVRRRARDLLRGLAALRAVARSDLPEPLPRAPGRWRGDHVRRLAGAARPGVPGGPRARHRDGHLRRLNRHRRGSRAADRRRPHGLARLGIDLLPERPDWPRRDPNATRIDWGGVGTFSAALFMLVLALVRGNDEGWGSTLIVSLFAGAAILLAAFFVIERRVSEPMLPLELFKRPSFTGVQLAAFAVSASMFALFLYITLYLQNYLGLSPFQAGLRYLPITVVSFFAAPIAGALLSRVPARLLMSGALALAGIGLLLMSGIDPDDTWTTLLPGFLVAGIGVGLLNPVVADVALSVVPKERSGMAAGINDTFRQVGVAVGVAVWGAIFIGRGADKVSELTAGTPTAAGDHPRQLMEAMSSGSLNQVTAGVPTQARPAAANAAGEGFLTGLNAVLTLAALLSFAGAVLALWLVREHEIQRQPMVPEREPQSDALPEAADA